MACPSCGSSDGNTLYDDGHAYCYVCETYTHANGVIETKTVKKTMNKDLNFYDSANSGAINDRNISAPVCLKYGVRQDSVGTKHYYPYHDEEGLLTSVKTRDVQNKQFFLAGEFSKATLFGQSLFPRGGRYLTIC